MRNKIIYIYIFSSFFLAQFLTLDVGPVKLSLARGSLILLLLIFILDTFKSNKIRLYKNYSYNFILLWFFYTLLNVAFGLQYSFTGWLKLLYLVGIYSFSTIIFTRYIKDLKTIEKIFYFIQIGIFIQMAIGIYEHYTGVYHWTSYAELFTTHPYFQRMRYPTAMQNNPNDFALLMYIGTFISIACGRLYSNKIMKFLSYSLVIISIYLIYISDSRSILLALIISFIYMFVNESSISKKNRIFLNITLIILGIFFTYFNIDRILFFINTKLRFSMDAGSEQVRMGHLIDAMKYLFNSFGFGIGAHGIIPWHNFWVEILTESGIIIFIGFLVFYSKLFINMNKASNDNDNIKTSIIAKSIASILFGFVVASLGPASILNIEWVGIIFAVFITFEKIFLEKP